MSQQQLQMELQRVEQALLRETEQALQGVYRGAMPQFLKDKGAGVMRLSIINEEQAQLTVIFRKLQKNSEREIVQALIDCGMRENRSFIFWMKLQGQLDTLRFAQMSIEDMPQKPASAGWAEERQPAGTKKGLVDAIAGWRLNRQRPGDRIKVFMQTMHGARTKEPKTEEAPACLASLYQPVFENQCQANSQLLRDWLTAVMEAAMRLGSIELEELAD